MMQDDAGIGRSEESLAARACRGSWSCAIGAPRIRVGGGRTLNPGWHTCRDVTNMLVISEAIVRGAIERRESRGSQWRFDHLDQEVEFGKVNFVTRRDGDTMRVVERSARSAPGAPPPAPRAQPLLRRGQAPQGISHRRGARRREGEPAARPTRPRRGSHDSRRSTGAARVRRPESGARPRPASPARRSPCRCSRACPAVSRPRSPTRFPWSPAWSCSTRCTTCSTTSTPTSPAAGTARRPNAGRAAPR